MSIADYITDIEAALETRLQALVDPWIVDPPSIAWEDVDFTPTTGQQYLRVHHLHNTPRDLFLEGGPAEMVGILQVDVVYPAGRGKVEAKRLAGQVADLFAPVQSLTTGAYRIDLLKTPAIAGGMNDGDGWYMVPVSIPWRAFPNS